MTWARRLKRVFNIDFDICDACGANLRIIACIEDPAVIQRILDHLDRRDAQPTRSGIPSARAPPQAALPGLND